MVENTGEKASAGRIRPLNGPVPVRVREDAGHAPVWVEVGGRELMVSEVRDVWELQDEWWRSAPIFRRYYSVSLSAGPVTLPPRRTGTPALSHRGRGSLLGSEQALSHRGPASDSTGEHTSYKDGMGLVIFRDMIGGGWYRQKV